MSDQTQLTRDMHIAEAGRWLMAQQFAIMQAHWDDLNTDTSETAVHETRKAIRRTLTIFKTVNIYFDTAVIAYFRRGLRKIMRRLARCRDIAIFRQNLATYQTATPQAAANEEFDQLAQYWTDQQIVAEVSLRAYLERPKVTNFLAEYALFTQTEAAGTKPDTDAITPVYVKHLAALLVQQRLAAVLAFEDVVAQATYAQFHQLRVQFKELRYTLGFFTPLLDASVATLEAHLNTIQDHLGFMNDAHMAQLMLAQTPGRETTVTTYLAHCKQTAQQLQHTFPTLWQTFNDDEWQRQLLTAVATI